VRRWRIFSKDVTSLSECLWQCTIRLRSAKVLPGVFFFLFFFFFFSPGGSSRRICQTASLTSSASVCAAASLEVLCWSRKDGAFVARARLRLRAHVGTECVVMVWALGGARAIPG